jgi:hypothetical protein
MLRNLRDANLDAWSKTLIQFVNTDAYAQATATILDTWLSSSVQFRKALDGALTQALTNLQMPTRPDVISLAERLTNIEMRLDDLEAKLDEALRPARKPAGTKNKHSPGENQL